MMRRAACLLLLFTCPALAQGVPESRTGIALPNSQSAAVEDSTAILVNPAGLANVEGFEMNVGAFERTDGTTSQTDVDGQFALRPMQGLAVGLGAGTNYVQRRGLNLRLSGALAAGDRTFSSGLALHALTAPGGRPDFMIDVGSQLRPARWLALAAGVENLGSRLQGPASLRGGMSVRPLGELLTVGLDARFIPGSHDLSSLRYVDNATVVPGLAARLHLGGFALFAGASAGISTRSLDAPISYEVLAGFELNGNHLGLGLLGGGFGVDTSVDGLAVGARARTSSARWQPLFADSGRWLSLTLVGEGVPPQEREGIIGLLFAEEPQPVAILAALDNAATDATVDGIVLYLKGLELGWGRLTEVRTAIEKLRAAGKQVVVHLDGGNDGDVYVASAADKIYLSPAASLELNGLRAELMYFGETLDKVGIVAEAISAGRYKSAPRTFTDIEPSAEEIEVQDALLDGAWQALTTKLAEGRGLSVEQVTTIIDRGGLTAAQALELQIVDGLVYADELDKRLEELVGRSVRLEERFLDREERTVRWDSPSRIALIPITGTIAMGGGGGGLLGDRAAGAEDITQAIDNAAKDDDVRAIILRIDSPGGDAFASDLIWHAIMKARKKKPVVATMGDVAASGGYYVAAAAHTILAEANTVTGSIGVFGLLFSAK